MVQFGYVALFSVAFPLAPIAIMLQNLISIRLGTQQRYILVAHS